MVIEAAGLTLLFGPQEGFNSPFEISTDAGAYLCNETYYRTLEALACMFDDAKGLPKPALFLHLPAGNGHRP